MSRSTLSATLGLVFATAVMAAAPAFAQAPAAPTPAMVTKDPATVPAGAYKLDKAHQSVIARIGHAGGFSYSTVRFGATEGMLTWDPAHIEASKITVTVDTKPNYAPIVYNLDPGSAMLLNVAQFPTATFVSTGIRRTGPTTGQVMGNLTLMGQTKPATIDASLVGAGKNGRGVSIIGFTGVMKIKRSDFGFTALGGAISNDIEVMLDAEFLPA